MQEKNLLKKIIHFCSRNLTLDGKKREKIYWDITMIDGNYDEQLNCRMLNKWNNTLEMNYIIDYMNK